MKERSLGVYNGFENAAIAMKEPYVESVLKSIRGVNESLKDGQVTRQEAAEYASLYDMEWANLGLMNELMNITGMATYYQEFHAEDGGMSLVLKEDGYNPVFMAEDKPMLSKGFIVEELNGVAAIKLLGVCPPSEDTSFEQVPVTMNFGVDLSLVDVDFPNIMSAERARAWLQEFYPDLINEIDERLLNHDGDSATSILALRGLDLTPLDASGDMIMRSCQALHHYLNSVIEPDSVLPYAVSCEGYVAFPEPDGETSFMYLKNKCDLMNLEQISLYQFPGDDNELKIRIVLVGQTAGEDEGKYADVVVGVDSITDMHTVWSLYYNQ